MLVRRLFVLASVLAILALPFLLPTPASQPAEAHAQTPQAALGNLDCRWVSVTDTPRSIAALTGLPVSRGYLGVRVWNKSTTQVVCLGDSTVNTKTASGVLDAGAWGDGSRIDAGMVGRCWPVCNSTTLCPEALAPVLTTIDIAYLRSSVAQDVAICFGSVN